MMAHRFVPPWSPWRGEAPPRRDRPSPHAKPLLTAIKAFHTIAWFSIESCMVYVLYAGFRRQSDRRTAIAAGVVAGESLIFAVNGFRCPLTQWAEALGADRGGVTDIYLPKWFAHNLPAIHVPLIALAAYLHIRNIRWTELGATRLGVWAIKQVVAPIDRISYRVTGRALLGGRAAPVLLLTTRGRRTGRRHVTPLIYICDQDRYVVCNVNPGFERQNPWTLNLTADPEAEVGVGHTSVPVVARQASASEVASYWPQLVALWPAYQEFYSRGGDRRIFVLEPVQPTGMAPAEDRVAVERPIATRRRAMIWAERS